MNAKDLAKLARGTIVTWSHRPSRNGYTGNQYLAVYVGECTVEKGRHSFDRKQVGGSRIVPIVYRDGAAFLTAAEQKVENRCILDVVGHPGTGADPLVYVQDLRKLADARTVNRAAERKAEKALETAAHQSRVDWLRSFGLTARFAGYNHEDVEHDGYGADVDLDTQGRVTIPYSLLQGLIEGPPE